MVGLGNVMLGDDGVGVCLTEAVRKCSSPTPSLRVEPVGLASPGHIYLLEGADAAIVVDAFEGLKNDMVLLRVEVSRLEPADAVTMIQTLEPHSVDALRLLVLARSAGVFNGVAYVLGIRPERMAFGEPLSCNTVQRALKAYRVLGRLLKIMGVDAVVDEACTREFLEKCCSREFMENLK